MDVSRLDQRIRFSVFEVDLQAREIRKHGIRLRLQEQPFKILTVLLQHSGAIVTREQLRQELWPGEVFVDFEKGVNTAVTKLRETLGDSRSTPRFIETIPRRGYRFIAPVEIFRTAEGKDQQNAPSGTLAERTLSAGTNGNAADELIVPVALPENISTASEAINAPPPARVQPARRLWTWLAAAVAALTMATTIMLVVHRDNQHRGRNHRIDSLAVMPLQNLSNDPAQEYFADGMTEALITKLAQGTSLRVISRTSVMRYKKVNRSLPDIARELGVDAIIEGSVLRSGERVRITVQLLNAAQDQHLWAQSFEWNDQDIIRLQDEVSRDIAAQVNKTLTPGRSAQAKLQLAISPEAFEAYSKGRYLWNQRTPAAAQRSLSYLNEAINREPEYALAYAGLADTYLQFGNFGLLSQLEAYNRATEAALRSLQLDPSLSQPHVILGERKAGQDWDWAGAEKEYRQALLLEPSNANAHYLLSSLLSLLKRHEEAISETRRAVQLDPLSASVGLQEGIALHFAGREAEAVQAFRRTLELNGTFTAAYVRLALVYLQQRRYSQALDEMQHALDTAKLDGGQNTSWFLPRHAQIYAAAGKQREAEALLRQLMRLPEPEQSAPNFALVYIALGKRKEAYQWLDTGFKNHDVDMTLIAVEPGYTSIRSEPQFRELLKRMNLPGSRGSDLNR